MREARGDGSRHRFRGELDLGESLDVLVRDMAL